ncbi:hypothetical protein GCM10010103_60790 [Streptomyces paradoxus]
MSEGPARSRGNGSSATGARMPGHAANDALVLAFGRLQGAANRMEYILGRALEAECGISHPTHRRRVSLALFDVPTGRCPTAALRPCP